MIFRVLTLFPEQFNDFKTTSIIGRAVEEGHVQIECVQIRDFSTNKHKSVDDAPFGGGQGMVMNVQPLKDALLSKPLTEHSHVVYLSPKGKRLTHQKAVSLSNYKALTLVCGHYEGIDQRFIDAYVDEEISIGDYILTGGELAAMVVIDAVTRLVPGVLRNEKAHEDESIASGLLEFPQYTRPSDSEEGSVPAVLLSGNHAEIAYWRFEKALMLTKERRPDLYHQFMKAEHDETTKRLLKKVLKTHKDNGII